MKWVDLALVRSMRSRAFQRAEMRPDVDFNDVGSTQELGLTGWPGGHRSALATLGKALEVLRRRQRIVEEKWP